MRTKLFNGDWKRQEKAEIDFYSLIETLGFFVFPERGSKQFQNIKKTSKAEQKN